MYTRLETDSSYRRKPTPSRSGLSEMRMLHGMRHHQLRGRELKRRYRRDASFAGDEDYGETSRL